MMAKESSIEWVDATWNPWMGCTKVSQGCINCYMFRGQKRFGHDPNVLRKSKTRFGDPLKWKLPKRIFVCSWSDFLHEDVPNEWRHEALKIIRDTPEHTYMILTKRIENLELMGRTILNDWPEHIWLGVTAEDQVMAETRIPLLLNSPAKTKFVSVEPMLGLIRFWQSWFPCVGFEHDGTPWPALDWVICGGESGPKCREMKVKWAVHLKEQCVRRGLPFFFKQWGGKRKDPDGAWGGRLLDGREWNEMPVERANMGRQVVI